MTQAFYTAISGIAASQQKINVIGDNIANINTVGYKESLINFSDVLYNTVSSGSAPTKSIGGTNSKQVGLGVQTASISKNFTSGTPQTTGQASDLYLDGQGFFCVQGANNEVLLTRAGNFKVDSEGYLVTSAGNRVLGTSSAYSVTSSATPIKIPQALTMDTTGNSDQVNFLTSDLSNLNSIKFTKSADASKVDYIVQVYHDGGQQIDVPVNISSAKNLDQIIALTNSAIDTALGYTGSGTHGVQLGIKTPCDGTLSFTIDQSYSGTSASGATISAHATAATSGITSIKIQSVASNFMDENKLARVSSVDDGSGHLTYTSKILDYHASIGPTDNQLNAKTLVSYDISNDGSISAMYSNGDKISVETNPETRQVMLKYTMADGTIVQSEDININANVIEPGNLQLQLGSVINENGLVAVGNNNFTPGPNSGEVIYSIASNNGFAQIESGKLESSNVDLTNQFAELIVAQRSIEANSRTFSTVSNVLQTLIQMGR
jgi:flagellar hook protein FlgE